MTMTVLRGAGSAGEAFCAGDAGEASCARDAKGMSCARDTKDVSCAGWVCGFFRFIAHL